MATFKTIRVEQRDIDRAIRKSSSRCVVALAVARQIPDASRIEVDVQTIRFTQGDERRTFIVPPAVAGYVCDFDAGDEISPFAFRLRTDREVITRKPVLTEAGLERAKARDRVNQAKRGVTKAAAIAADPNASPEARTAARATVRKQKAKAKAAAEAKAKVDAEHAGKPTTESTAGANPPMPRVFRSGRRNYGQRVLRINGGTSSGVSGS